MSGGRPIKVRPTLLGARLTQARTAKGWRQRDLATRADVATQQITQWERAVQAPSLDNLITIADALGVSLDWLVGRSDTEVVGAGGAPPGSAFPHVNAGSAPGVSGADADTSSAVTSAAAACG